MHNTNVNSPHELKGDSHAKRYFLMPARRESWIESAPRIKSQFPGEHSHQYEDMRQHGFVKYSAMPKPT